MNFFLFKYWPITVIILTCFIFSSPYFFQNKVPYPAAFQNSFFSPWSDYKEYAIPVKNNALSDVVTQIYPWKHFTIEELKNGSIPWWNPFSFSGNPHVADVQTAVFSPFNIIFFIFPFIDAWSISILLQPLLAGIFMMLFLNKLGISKEGSLIGSTAFMFCGFLVVWMPYGTLSMSIAFLPLGLFAIESYFKRASLIPLIVLPVSLSISFFSGHFQTSLYLAVMSFAYLLFKFRITKNAKSYFLILIAFMFGILLSLIQIIPTIEVYKNSLRSDLYSTTGAIPFNYLITAIAPNFYGNPVTRNDWIGNYAEWASFIGIIPLALAFISLFIKKNKANILFFAFTGIAALALAINTPLQQLLVELKLPVLSTSIPSRIIVLFSFAFAVLAGFGLDALKEYLEKKRLKKAILACALLMCLILIIWLILFFKILPPDKTIIAIRNLLIPTFFSMFALGLIMARLKMNLPVYIVIYSLVLMTIIDSFLFAQKWIPFDSKKLVFPNLPVITAMQKEVGSGRVFGKFGAYIDTYYHLPSIEGYDPLYIQRYGEFLTSAKSGTRTSGIKSLALLDKNAKYADRVIDLLGVTVLFHVIGDTNKDWAYPVWREKYYEKYVIFYHDDKFQLYKNKTALPRAKLFYNYEVIKNEKDIIKRFYSEEFDFRNKLILEEDPGLKQLSSFKVAERTPERRTSEEVSKASIISYTANKVIVEVESELPGLLFLSDNYYPKWKASVNGKEVKIYRTDYTLRSVKVPEGKSKVEFYYSPWSAI